MRILWPALLGLGLFTQLVNARPVSYPGGWTLMSKNDDVRNFIHIHYSPTVRTSLGYKYEDWRDQEFTLNALQINNLLKRWNQKDSQANLYAKSGLGVANPDSSGSSEIAGFTGVSADWEDRRYFISYENRFTQTESFANFYQQSIRAGLAPYQGDYGDLHTWLMIELRHRPESADSLTVTPLLRLFKQEHLFETGVSDRGDVMFNYIYRY